MKKVLGIIAEYNPFHNGHLYHLNTSKEITHCDYSIAVISGNFTQRGNTSLVDKWLKTKSAIKNGVDLVIELPVLYSISSAENFAEGSIKILNSLGIVNYLSFGSETENIKLLSKYADILCEEPKEYKKLLNEELSSGISYPKARQKALQSYLHYESLNDIDALNCSNDILGIEYLKALKKSNSKITPIAIKRNKSNYSDTRIHENIASATAIRKFIQNDNTINLKNILPKISYEILVDAINSQKIVKDLSCYEKEILYILRRMSIEQISKLADVSEGLEFGIKKASISSKNLSELIDSIKSKRYTTTRIYRILLYALLDITKKDIEISKKTNPYIRILGFNEKGKSLISDISKSNPNLQIITSVKKFTEYNKDNNLKLLLEKDILATNIYTLGYTNSGLANRDYTEKIIQ